MNFREYRPKQGVTAAVIDVESIELPAHDRVSPDDDFITYHKGDYAELLNDRLIGWAKADFESRFVATRAPRQVNKGKGKRKVERTIERTNDRVTPLPDLATK